MMMFGLFLLVAFAIGCGAYLVVSTARGRSWALEWVRAMSVLDPHPDLAQPEIAEEAPVERVTRIEDPAQADTIQRPALAA